MQAFNEEPPAKTSTRNGHRGLYRKYIRVYIPYTGIYYLLIPQERISPFLVIIFVSLQLKNN